MRPKISIITVVRNAPQDLEETLTSLEALEYKEIEIVVIDGASTDNTIEVIKKHQNSIGYWVSEPDKGLYDAMNKGINAATGEYLWFINAGDFPYESDVLNKIFNNSENSNSDIYFGEAMILNSKGEEMGLRAKRLPKTLTWKSLKKGMVVCHQAFIAKKSIAPLYDLQYKYVADIDWVIKSLKKAKTITNTHQILCKFTEGGISTQHRKKSLKERYKVMQKHYKPIPNIIAHLKIAILSLIQKDYR